VAAFYVVGINLQERHGVHHGFVGEHDVLVVLVGIGFLGIAAHQDVAIKNSTRAVVDNSLEKLIAEAVGMRMIDKNLIIHMLIFIHQIHAQHIGFTASAAQRHMVFVANHAAIQGDGIGRKMGIALQIEKYGVDECGDVVFVLQFVMIERGIGANKNFRHRIDEASLLIYRVVALHQLQAAVFTQDHQVVVHNKNAFIVVDDIHHLQRHLHLHIVGHIDEHAVGGKSVVERHKAIFFIKSNFAIVLTGKLGIFLKSIGQAADDNAILTPVQ
jgi:hypothetical protein